MHRAFDPRFVVLFALLATGTACDIFDTPTPPTTSRIAVTAEGDREVEIVTSTNFFTQIDVDSGDQIVTFVESDTVNAAGTYEQSYSIGSAQRFVVRVSSPDAIEDSHTVTLEAFIDDDSRYDTTRDLEGEDFLQFLFVFN